jgi:hypothetical protein
MKDRYYTIPIEHDNKRTIIPASLRISVNKGNSLDDTELSGGKRIVTEKAYHFLYQNVAITVGKIVTKRIYIWNLLRNHSEVILGSTLRIKQSLV